VFKIDFTSACIFKDAYADVDFDHFIVTITNIVAQDGYNVTVDQRNDNTSLVLGVADCQIRLHFSRRPLAADGFRNPLGSRFLQQQDVDFGGIIQSHTQHILITVSATGSDGNNFDLGNIFDTDTNDALENAETTKEVALRLQILHMATLYICNYAKPDLIHWTQSEQMFTGEGYMDFINEELPLSVLLHPYILDEEQEDEISAVIVGAEHALGVSLYVNPTSLSFADLHTMVCAFVNNCRDLGKIPNHGDTVRLADQWTINVLRTVAQDSKHPEQVALTVLDTSPVQTPRQPIKVKRDVTNELSAENPQEMVRNAFLNKKQGSGNLLGRMKHILSKKR